jgi:hypothetical protein
VIRNCPNCACRGSFHRFSAHFTPYFAYFGAKRAESVLMLRLSPCGARAAQAHAQRRIGSIPPETPRMTDIPILEGDRPGAALLVAILPLNGSSAAAVDAVEMALQHTRSANPPAVLVVDLDLRDNGDGQHAARLARRINPNLQVISLTASPTRFPIINRS